MHKKVNSKNKMNKGITENLNEKICGYCLIVCFFMILLSTSLVNIFIFLSVSSSLLLILRKNDFYEIFIKNSTNFCLLILIVLFCFSFFYISNEFSESLSVFKKYVKLLYIPLCFYTLQITWIRNKSIDFFIYGSTIVLIISYLKFFDVMNPVAIYNIFSYEIYNEKLNSGVQVFQSSITHGIVLAFYSYLTFLKAEKDKKYIYYFLSFSAFYNVLFMNDSRASYIIILILALNIMWKSIKKNCDKNKYIIPFIILSILFFSNKNIIDKKIEQTYKNYNLIENSSFDTSLGLRYVWWKNGFENILNKPLFGYGVGSYKSTILNYMKKNNINEDNLISNNPHNEFISISTQLGIFGLTLFIIFLYLFYKISSQNSLGFCVFTILLISCLFNSVFYDNILGIFLVLIISYSMGKEKNPVS